MTAIMVNSCNVVDRDSLSLVQRVAAYYDTVVCVCVRACVCVR